ncbi:MAG: DegT/DnrJ/EryC1/StrS family aminotransferase [Pseudomonadota bacterium]
MVRPEALGGRYRAEKFRNRLLARLEERGISCRQGTHAVHALGYYQKKYGLGEDDLPHSLAAERLSLALPLFVGLRLADQRRVVAELEAAKEKIAK